MYKISRSFYFWGRRYSTALKTVHFLLIPNNLYVFYIYNYHCAHYARDSQPNEFIFGKIWHNLGAIFLRRKQKLSLNESDICFIFSVLHVRGAVILEIRLLVHEADNNITHATRIISEKCRSWCGVRLKSYCAQIVLETMRKIGIMSCFKSCSLSAGARALFDEKPVTLARCTNGRSLRSELITIIIYTVRDGWLTSRSLIDTHAHMIFYFVAYQWI